MHLCRDPRSRSSSAQVKDRSGDFLCILFTEEDAAAFTGWSDALLPALNARGSLSKVQGNKVSCGNDFK
jgi:hypothetical protein